MLTKSRQSGQRIYYRLTRCLLALIEHVEQIFDEPRVQQIWSDIILSTFSLGARMPCTKGLPKLSSANVVINEDRRVLLPLLCKLLFRCRMVSFSKISAWES